jgi:hypothetical protein
MNNQPYSQIHTVDSEAVTMESAFFPLKVKAINSNVLDELYDWDTLLI